MGGRGGFNRFKKRNSNQDEERKKREQKDQSLEETTGLKDLNDYNPDDIEDFDVEARVWSEDLQMWIDIGTLTLTDDTVIEDVFRRSKDQSENNPSDDTPPNSTLLFYENFNPETIDRYEPDHIVEVLGYSGLYYIGTLWLKNGKHYTHVLKQV